MSCEDFYLHGNAKSYLNLKINTLEYLKAL